MASSLGMEGLQRRFEIDSPGVQRQFERSIERQQNNPGTDIATPSIESGNQGSSSFSELLTESVNKVNTYQKQADRAISELVAGRTKNVHETMLAVERADISLKLMTQVRNKILESYREIMRMQV